MTQPASGPDGSGREAQQPAGRGSLEGVRVLDLSRLLPGGYCSLLMADAGADVIKVEDTGMGDYVRWAPPYYGDDSHQALGTRSALYLALNRGKRSIRIDLKSDAGRGAFLRLARDADVVLESFRPGVLDKLGVGYEALREVNPGIVVCAISGYGATGPNVTRAGHDTNYLALNGLLGLTGAADGPPVQAAGQIADLGGGGLMATFGILAALWRRERTGEGQFVDVSMTDGALSWLAMVAGQFLCDGQVPSRGAGMLNGGVACYLPYECADGWVCAGRSSRSSGRRSARAPAGRTSWSTSSRRPGRRVTAWWPRSSASARRLSGRHSTTNTIAASSPYSTSTRRWTRSSPATAGWWSRWSSPSWAPSVCWGCRSSSRPRRATPPAPPRRWASTRREVLREAGLATGRSPR